MRRLPVILVAALLLAPPALADEPSTVEKCTNRVQAELVNVHDTYRSVLFGSRENADGDFEVLTGGTTDKARRGIFETQRRLTSELVEPLVESYRVFRCRMIAVCSTMKESFGVNGGQADIQPLGCASETLDLYPECYLGPQDADAIGPDGASATSDLTGLLAQCDTYVTRTLAAERSVLRLAVAYDSGYRSMLQFSGIMDWMLEGFPTRAVKAISQMVNLLGKLHQIPCFIGQCDNPHSDYLSSSSSSSSSAP